MFILRATTNIEDGFQSSLLTSVASQGVAPFKWVNSAC